MLAVVYFFSSLSYELLFNLTLTEYKRDIAKSPYFYEAQNSETGTRNASIVLAKHTSNASILSALSAGGMSDSFMGRHVQPSEATLALHAWASMFDWSMMIITAIFAGLLMLLRQRVRQRFLIPAMCERRAGDSAICGLFEDCMCMIFCQACAMAQMARHVLALLGQGNTTSCEPYADPGPIEAFPVAHTMPPGMHNSMPVLQQPSQQQQDMHMQRSLQHRSMHQQPQSYAPPAYAPSANAPPSYLSPQSACGAPAQGGEHENGVSVALQFPAPACSSGVAVPTASHVPVATHVWPPDATARTDTQTCK